MEHDKETKVGEIGGWWRSNRSLIRESRTHVGGAHEHHRDWAKHYPPIKPEFEMLH
jgi:hypothetical protein